MIIVKAGGGKTINWNYICEDVALICKSEKVILVHGASEKRDEIAKKLGFPTRTVVSPSGITSVYTDEKALEVFLMVYCGLVNKSIVAKLQKFGVNAIGLSGVDGRLWEGKRKKDLFVKDGDKTKLLTNNFTGRVEKINTKLLKILIKNNFMPVVCSPAISYEGEIINVDNDLAVSLMAKSLGVKKIVVLFEAPGFLKEFGNDSSLVRSVNKHKVEEVLPFAQGRMKKKILGVKRAIEFGVEEIYFGDGRKKYPIRNALKGQGTIIK